jgi:hypothetical protein
MWTSSCQRYSLPKSASSGRTSLTPCNPELFDRRAGPARVEGSFALSRRLDSHGSTPGTCGHPRAPAGTAEHTGVGPAREELPANGTSSGQRAAPSSKHETLRRCTRFVPEAALRRCQGRRKPCKRAKADARTRTGAPFITREERVGNARPFGGTRDPRFPSGSGDFAALAVDARTRACPS